MISSEGKFEMSSSTPISVTADAIPESNIPLITNTKVKYLIRRLNTMTVEISKVSTMVEYSSQDVALYLNAINKTMARNGVTKVISDDFWTNEIVPILYPLWDSDRDKLESYMRYKTGVSLMNKNKYQRNQKTGQYKWVHMK